VDVLQLAHEDSTDAKPKTTATNSGIMNAALRSLIGRTSPEANRKAATGDNGFGKLRSQVWCRSSCLPVGAHTYSQSHGLSWTFILIMQRVPFVVQIASHRQYHGIMDPKTQRQWIKQLWVMDIYGSIFLEEPLTSGLGVFLKTKPCVSFQSVNFYN
jgi:hypothetical protein